MSDIETLRQHVEDFLYITEGARALSERCRDYKDNKQWTADEAAKLRSRNQAPVVDNRVKPKVEGLKGLIIQRRSDPKAFPRTKKHEAGAEAVTDGLRFVWDNADGDEVELGVADNVIVEGYGGAIVDIDESGAEPEVKVVQIPWDRIYFDPHSRSLDFKDAQYIGMVLWMDTDVAKQTFKGKADVIDRAITEWGNHDETLEDRPRSWIDQRGDRKRVRIAHEFFMSEGVWKEAVFTCDDFLLKPKDSRYLDEAGKPCCPIELSTAYIDRDNNRYGEAAFWLDMQDEINHRRSKFLHTMSNRQTYARKGAIKDVPALKRELAKPIGHVEFEGNKFGEDFGIIPNADQADAQFQLLLKSMESLDASSFNAQLSGERQGDLSGEAIKNLQLAGMLEVNSLLNNLSNWKKRINRQIWARIKQVWTQEKWIRVTDDQNKLRWVGFNISITRKQQIEEFINDESQPFEARQQAALLFQQAMQMNDPRLGEVVKTDNPIPELDVDILLEQSVNTLNVRQEQFRILADLAAARPQEVPFKLLIELSELRGDIKKRAIEELDAQMKAAAEANQQAMALDTADKQVTIEGKQIKNAREAAAIDKDVAEVTNINMDSISKQVKNQQLMARPDPNPQASL